VVAGEKLTEFAKTHPWRWALLSGIAILVWSLTLLGLGIALWWIIPGAVLFGLVNGYVWRPGGPGPRWNAELRRRYPPKR
jgi:hypothetical protein